MKQAESNVAETTERAEESILRFPTGLLGFEKVKRYVLLADPQEAPFAWLEMVEEPKLTFLVVPPAFVSESYEPDISQEDVEALDLRGPEEAMVLNIVTLHSDNRATVNLKGPIVINLRTRVGRQVVPMNVASFELQHPLHLTPAS